MYVSICQGAETKSYVLDQANYFVYLTSKDWPYNMLFLKYIVLISETTLESRDLTCLLLFIRLLLFWSEFLFLVRTLAS